MRILWAIHHPGVLRWLGSTGTHRTPWPHVRQVCRLARLRIPVRRGVPTGPASVEVAYFITSLPPERADAARLLTLIRGHWGIESAPRSAEGGHSTQESCQEWAVWLEGQAWGAEAAPGLKLPRQCGGGRPSALVRC